MSTPLSPSPPATATTFADRIRLLIQRVGSATEIARRCGFSEGVVRSWRDGNTDPSRARCVTLARTLGISLIWLVAGEGSMQPDHDLWLGDDTASTERTAAHPLRARFDATPHTIHGQVSAVDTQRLNTAIKILQSEFELAGVSLVLAGHADLLASLYDALGPGGALLDTGAMLGFNRRLAERLQRERQSS